MHMKSMQKLKKERQKSNNNEPQRGKKKYMGRMKTTTEGRQERMNTLLNG